MPLKEFCFFVVLVVVVVVVPVGCSEVKRTVVFSDPEWEFIS